VTRRAAAARAAGALICMSGLRSMSVLRMLGSRRRLIRLCRTSFGIGDNNALSTGQSAIHR
jgi:hypothetical protein